MHLHTANSGQWWLLDADLEKRVQGGTYMQHNSPLFAVCAQHQQRDAALQAHA